MCENCGCRALARSNVYQFLGLGFGYPDAASLATIWQRRARVEASLDLLRYEETLDAFTRFASSGEGLALADWEAAHLRCFGHAISKECPPYETEYGQSHIFQQTQTLADVAGFYTAFGLQPAPTMHERLDHISVELEFMHFLCLKEAHALVNGHAEEQLGVCRQAQRKFLDEHLGQWVLAFIEGLAAKASENVYQRVAAVLGAFLSSELEAFGLEPAKTTKRVFLEPPEEENLECEECPLVVPFLPVASATEAG